MPVISSPSRTARNVNSRMRTCSGTKGRYLVGVIGSNHTSGRGRGGLKKRVRGGSTVPAADSAWSGCPGAFGLPCAAAGTDTEHINSLLPGEAAGKRDGEVERERIPGAG